MAKTLRSNPRPNTGSDQKAWALDQLTKSEFFHQKLHEWGLLATAARIERTKGETLKWDVNSLGISRRAWDKAIHRGIKPVVVFAHPSVLRSISGSVAYYRMLAMVSQKSMNRVRLSVTAYEAGEDSPDDETALSMARHLNLIISRLVEFDEQIDAREFDLWRGMAAGSQAQGSWQNTKGSRIDVIIKGLIQRRLREKGHVVKEDGGGQRMELRDGRVIVFADEPDVAVYEGKEIQAAIEIKGGIDAAGVLERIGAALKSLRRVRDENPRSTTILLLQRVSVTETARRDLEINREAVTDWFAIEDILEDDRKREQVFKLLRI
ncbi:MAG: XcyI family restriction endonuclease [Planctomycetes bacterium]|nr:XcyI family restriction endonuclease [Planctomycetota bacterium]MBM4078289.1 XcyI family restriction endonuclease [Planctomycetota bacterium]MBM4083561.1 XcyI family restriction endonuclease [Planctomycetota bacterium]